MNLKNLVNGWVNYIFEDKEIEKLAYERAEICASCPSNKEGDLLVMLNDKLQTIKGHYCSECGCPLSPKIRSVKEKCDAGKW
jgi:hypothetical protein